jgi:cysteine desulfurase
MLESVIYLDHAATTPVCEESLQAMLPFFSTAFGNASSLYSLGQEAREAVEIARAQVAEAIGADPDEVFFTSGGTEADNWALKGAALAFDRPGHILLSSIEHHAVLEAGEWLRDQGWNVELVPVDGCGLVDPADVAGCIRPETALVSVMHANNEVGTIQPVAAIGALCRERGVLFHVDAVQTVGSIPVCVNELGCDLLSLSAHKFYGPKGAGALYVRHGTHLAPLVHGGRQESGRRGGTVNVPAVVGMGAAVEKATAVREAEAVRTAALRKQLVDQVLSEVTSAVLTGHPSLRLPNNVHFCFAGVEAEPLLIALDAQGICASAGSACSAGSNEPSHVLLAMGVDRDLARGALRLTLGRSTTTEQIAFVASALVENVNDLRRLA